MTEFQRIKAELKRRCESTKHFTKAFLQDYKDAVEKTEFNIKNKIDDSYYVENCVLVRHSFDKVFASKFYQQNPCAYCVFLEIALEFRIVD